MQSKNIGIWAIPVLILAGAAALFLRPYFLPPSNLERILTTFKTYGIGTEEKWERLEWEWEDSPNIIDGRFAFEEMRNYSSGDLEKTYRNTVFEFEPYCRCIATEKWEDLRQEVEGIHSLNLITQAEKDNLLACIESGRIDDTNDIADWIDRRETAEYDYFNREEMTDWLIPLRNEELISENAISELENEIRRSVPGFDPFRIVSRIDPHYAIPIKGWNPQETAAMEKLYRQAAEVHPSLEFRSITVTYHPRKTHPAGPEIEVEIDFGDEILRDRVPIKNYAFLGSCDHQPLGSFPFDANGAFEILNMRLNSQDVDLRFQEIRPTAQSQILVPQDSIYYFLEDPEIYPSINSRGNFFFVRKNDPALSECWLKNAVEWLIERDFVEQVSRPQQEEWARNAYLKEANHLSDLLLEIPGRTLAFPSMAAGSEQPFKDLPAQLESLTRGDLKADEIEFIARRPELLQVELRDLTQKDAAPLIISQREYNVVSIDPNEICNALNELLRDRGIEKEIFHIASKEELSYFTYIKPSDYFSLLRTYFYGDCYSIVDGE